MGAVIDISILGDKALSKKLARLDKAVQKKYVRSSLRIAAKEVKREARKDVPVDSGGLKRSIKIKSTRRSRSSTGVRVMFDDDHFYGKFHEWGAPGKGIEKDSWLFPAIDDHRVVLLNKVAAALRSRIEGHR